MVSATVQHCNIATLQHCYFDFAYLMLLGTKALLFCRPQRESLQNHHEENHSGWRQSEHAQFRSNQTLSCYPHPCKRRHIASVRVAVCGRRALHCRFVQHYHHLQTHGICTLHVRFECSFTCFVYCALQAEALGMLGCTHLTDPTRSSGDSVDSSPHKINGCIQVELTPCTWQELDKVVYFL
jgi:hypothetical protein